MFPHVKLLSSGPSAGALESAEGRPGGRLRTGGSAPLWLQTLKKLLPQKTQQCAHIQVVKPRDVDSKMIIVPRQGGSNMPMVPAMPTCPPAGADGR